MNYTHVIIGTSNRNQAGKVWQVVKTKVQSKWATGHKFFKIEDAFQIEVMVNDVEGVDDIDILARACGDSDITIEFQFTKGDKKSRVRQGDDSWFYADAFMKNHPSKGDHWAGWGRRISYDGAAIDAKQFIGIRG